MRKARIWRAFLIKERKFSKNKNAWLGREDSNLRMVESKSAASMSDRVCSAAITELRSRGIRYRAYDQKGFPTMAVSHAIAALEARHETKLFDRIGRRIALTEACRVFLMEARAILARAGAAELAQSEFGTLKRGTLCVQASQTIAGYTLPRHLVAFQRAYPRLWIQRPSSERRRDFNPPDSCAAQRTL